MNFSVRALLVLPWLVVGCVDDLAEGTPGSTDEGTTGGATTMPLPMDPSASTTLSTSGVPTTGDPTTDEPTTDEPTTDEPTTGEPTTDEPTTDEPTTDEPTSTTNTTDTTGTTDTTDTTGDTETTTTTDPTVTSTTDPTDTTTTGDTETTTGDTETTTTGVPECFVDDECDDTLPCTLDTCVDGTCQTTPIDGAPAPAELQTDGDCLVVECIDGAPQSISDDGDLPDDDNVCTDDVCFDGTPSHPPVATGPCTGGVCDGAGNCVACMSPSDCTALPPDDDCQTRTCVDNTCGQSFAGSGTQLAVQDPGDCVVQVCDGVGGSGPENDDADLPVDGLECTSDLCTDGTPSNPPLDPGTTCSAGVCDGIGGCVGCLDVDDCEGTSTFCQAITCELGTCGVDNTPAGTALPDASQTVQCQVLECDGTGGIQGTPTPGVSCEDNLFCNGADTCDDTGTCTHAGSSCTETEACFEGFDLCAANVWINEFHYDNTGGDVNEFVEVAVDAGIAIDTITVTLYNGANGQSYNTMALTTFTVGNTVNGITFYSRTLPANGIQNDTEAIALDISGTVLEFIGYEGTFAATNGAANGLTSIDIGVFEPGTTPVGSSLGRISTGRHGSDFTWSLVTAGAGDTPGGANEGQTITP